MKIRKVRCHVAQMGASWLTGSVIANPLSAYPEYFANRASWFGEMSAGVIEIVLEDGTQGFGFVGGGKGTLSAVILEEQMGARSWGARSSRPNLFRNSSTGLPFSMAAAA